MPPSTARVVNPAVTAVQQGVTPQAAHQGPAPRRALAVPEDGPSRPVRRLRSPGRSLSMKAARCTLITSRSRSSRSRRPRAARGLVCASAARGLCRTDLTPGGSGSEVRCALPLHPGIRTRAVCTSRIRVHGPWRHGDVIRSLLACAGRVGRQHMHAENGAFPGIGLGRAACGLPQDERPIGVKLDPFRIQGHRRAPPTGPHRVHSVNKAACPFTPAPGGGHRRVGSGTRIQC